MNSHNSDTTCPCCGRLLPLAGLRSGKVGCSKCRSVYFWDRSTGILTPLAPLAKGKRVFHLAGIIAGLLALLIIFLIFLHFAPLMDRQPPDSPGAVIDEARRHLKSLAE